MLVEINGKSGRVCDLAKAGKIRCPLMIRSTSEDVITSHLFGSLSCIDARWWLPDLLNAALNVNRFRRQIFRKLRIDLWVKQKGVPTELTPWAEGQTEVDVVIRWLNPRTTVFIEMKYGSPLSQQTKHNKNQSAFPADQLIRNIRIGLWKNHWYADNRLFEVEPDNFYVVLISPRTGSSFVDQYRSNERILKSIPNSDRLIGLPEQPFVGEVSYSQICQILQGNRKYLNRSECTNADFLERYIDLKLSQLKTPL